MLVYIENWSTMMSQDKKFLVDTKAQEERIDKLLDELEVDKLYSDKDETKTKSEDSWFYESCSMLFFKPINWFFSFLHFNREQKSEIRSVDQVNRKTAANELISVLKAYQKERDSHAPSSLYTFFCSGFTLSYLFKKNEDEIIDNLITAIRYGSSEQVSEEDNDHEFKPIDHSYFSCIRNNALGRTLRSYIKNPDNAHNISLITEKKMPKDQSQYTIREFISAINERVAKINNQNRYDAEIKEYMSV